MEWFSFAPGKVALICEFKDAQLCPSKSGHSLTELKLIELKVRLKKWGFYVKQ